MSLAFIEKIERDALKATVEEHRKYLAQQEHQLQQIHVQAVSIQSSFEGAQAVSAELSAKQAELNAKLEGFYGKQIEIFGLFIAIFSFIIAGIQIAAKADGSFLEKMGTSAAIFIPVTFCIVILLLTIRWTSRRA